MSLFKLASSGWDYEKRALANQTKFLWKVAQLFKYFLFDEFVDPAQLVSVVRISLQHKTEMSDLHCSALHGKPFVKKISSVITLPRVELELKCLQIFSCYNLSFFFFKCYLQIQCLEGVGSLQYLSQAFIICSNNYEFMSLDREFVDWLVDATIKSKQHANTTNYIQISSLCSAFLLHLASPSVLDPFLTLRCFQLVCSYEREAVKKTETRF